MPILISTQKQMLDQRRCINECYICGTTLPPKCPGWRSQVISEHVVPRTLLGKVPTKPADAWSVVLYVHKECEKNHKNHRDQLMKILQMLGNQSTDDWSKEDIGLLLSEFDIDTQTHDGSKLIHSISGVGSAMLAPVLWARGMHAALYGKALPAGMSFITQPPVPIWNHTDEDVAEGLAAYEVRRNGLLGLLRVAIHTHNVDEIRAWGGKLQYQCAWRKELLGSSGGWGCTWALEFPGVHEWAMTARNVDSPWHGYYEIDDLPPNAAVVGQAETDQYNRYVEASRKGP